MLLTPRRCSTFVLFLFFPFAVSCSWRTLVFKDAPANLEVLVKQCMEATTPMQCRAALPACEQVAGFLTKQSPSRQLDRIYGDIANAVGSVQVNAWPLCRS